MTAETKVLPVVPADAAAELDVLTSYLPASVRQFIDPPVLAQLLEIVMDLGRRVQLRFSADFRLVPHLVQAEDLEYIVQRVGAFRSDNRVGIEGTLHRISAIRNRYQDLVGVTIRVGRHLPGTAAPVRPWLQSQENLLILGPPGSGKTTLLRDLTRLASTDLRRRVMVVDTSNEIGGYGNLPHPAIGVARRIQVPNRADQYRLLLEAVQNHTPEVIVVDEIGTREEAAAVASIAERGVQLIATAHGRTLWNLIKNAELNLLLGGVRIVSYGAATGVLGASVATQGARRMTVQERVGEPTFQSLVELSADASRTLRVFDTASVVDALLDGLEPPSPILLPPTLGQTLDEVFSDPETIQRYGDCVDWYKEMLSGRRVSTGDPP